MRQNGHTPGSLVLLPPSCSLLPMAPCPDQDSAGPAAGGGTRPQAAAKLLLGRPHHPQRGCGARTGIDFS